MGWVALISLTLLALAAALSWALRAKLQGRAEVVLATTALWNFLILGPVIVLGLLDRLTATKLGFTSLGTFVTVLGLSLVGTRPGAHVRALGRMALSLLKLPWDALQASWQSRSLVFVGVLASGLLIPYTIVLSFLAPSDSWDGIWYHETMVGFAIQNAGFKPVDLPMSLQLVNGYARFCESTNLWFVIFTDRRLIEVVNSLFAPAMMASVYVLAKRYATDRVTAMGWACSLILMPGTLLELRSTYIDVHWATICLLAVHFCTRPRMRMRDAWLAVVSLTLLISAKNTALLWAPPLSLLAAVRLAAGHGGSRPLATAATLFGGGLLILASTAFSYLRNWIHFHNPFWPILIDNQTLNLHFPGFSFGVNMFAQDKPFKHVLEHMYSLPVPGQDWADTRVYGYGLGIPFVTVPLAIVAAVSAMLLAGATVLRRLAGAATDVLSDRRLLNLFLAVGPVLGAGYFTPSIAMARFNLHMVGLLLVLVAWWIGRYRLARLGDAVVSINIVTALMMLWWADPGWGVPIKQAYRLAKMSAQERVAHPTTPFSIEPRTAAARERELGPGTVAVFSDDYSFPSVLWNERYTNKVVYVRWDGEPNEYLNRVNQLGATWVANSPGGPQSRALLSAGWQEVGLTSQNQRVMAYRRPR